VRDQSCFYFILFGLAADGLSLTKSARFDLTGDSHDNAFASFGFVRHGCLEVREVLGGSTAFLDGLRIAVELVDRV
jgi:hypothetical protein